jgi:hypothetical protein
VQTAAFNLPNDEFVREKKGSKKVLLKNVMDAKYRLSGKPIANRVLDPEQRNLISFDAYFNHVLFHELSHGLGPGMIATPDGKRVDIRFLLKDTLLDDRRVQGRRPRHLEHPLREGPKLLTSFDERAALRDVRRADVPLDALRHRRGARPRHRGAVELAARKGSDRARRQTARSRVDNAKMREGIRSLATELLTLKATGDYARAQRLLAKYGVSNPEIASTIEKLKDIPVDITPVFTAAGEK